MRLLLDTCAFIWMDQDPSRFRQNIVEVLTDPTNQLWVSYVSLWEIQVKVSNFVFKSYIANLRHSAT